MIKHKIPYRLGSVSKLEPKPREKTKEIENNVIKIGNKIINTIKETFLTFISQTLPFNGMNTIP